MKIRFTLTAVVLALAWLPEVAAAQIFTPSYLAPRQASDLGIHISDGWARGGGLAVEGVWRRGFGSYDLGFRGGIAETSGDAVLLIGGDYRRPLMIQTEPLIMALTGGAQAALGSGSAFGVDAGLTVGSTFNPEGVLVTPYLHPRIALVRSAPRESLGLELLADLGVEVEIQPNLIFRLALGFGSETADLGIGLAWR
ncbi:hypothetical protein BH23GEM8_BH23GEM8_23730 [soil metagenome]